MLGINRGFDVSDEGLYALLADPIQENIAGVFNYDLFFKLIFKVSGLQFGLIGLRILRLLTCFLAAGALLKFWRNLTNTPHHSFSNFLVFFSAIMGSYGFLSQTLSYNSINLMVGCIWLGIVSKERFSSLNLITLGFALALLFYSKVTVFVILSIFTFGFLFWKQNLASLLKSILIIALPFLFLENLFFWTLDDSGVFRYLAATDLVNYRADYSYFLLIKYGLVGLFWVLCVFIPFYIFGYLKGEKIIYRLIWGIFSIGLWIWIARFTTITEEINHYLLLGTIALLAYIFPSLKFNEISTNQKVYISLLLIFPFILHFGSNVYFLRLAIHYWVFWLLVLFFFVDFKRPIGRVVFNFILPASTLILVANGVSLYSYNYYNYFEETDLWEYREGKSILLPKKQVDLYQKLKAKLNEQDETKMISIFRNPGISFMLGETNALTPGVWAPDQLQYFFPTDYLINTIIYNGSFEFPFSEENWKLIKEYEAPEKESLKLYFKE
ncbi:MAG: hypothetical protein HWD85_11910 [Flavobacteriaceae bacterium]|nr:hypothetical protein [Flavobacteriaceae bacterium]